MPIYLCVQYCKKNSPLLQMTNGRFHNTSFVTLVEMFTCHTTQNKSLHFFHQDGRVVKALDLSSNGRMSAWVRTPLLVEGYFKKSGFKTDGATVQKRNGCFPNKNTFTCFYTRIKVNFNFRIEKK